MLKSSHSKASLLIIMLLGAMITSCSFQASKTADEQKPEIVSSIYPIYFFTSEIVKDKFQVLNLSQNGVEIHDYELSPKDLEDINKSKMLIVNGNLEPWLEDLEAPLEEKGVSVLVLTEDMSLLEGSDEHHEVEGSHEEEMKDPHVWLDPILALKMVNKISDEVIILDPQNTEFYEENTKDLKNRIIKLDQNFRSKLKNCENKFFMTTHAAFAYTAKRYGLEQIAIVGINPNAEPTISQMMEITNQAREHKLNTIFFESAISPKLSETIANEVGAQVSQLNPLETLDEKAIESGSDYFTVMEQNLENLSASLTCT